MIGQFLTLTASSTTATAHCRSRMKIYCYNNNAWSTMSSSSMDEAVKVRNWPITVECKKNSWLWLVNLLLL